MPTRHIFWTVGLASLSTLVLGAWTISSEVKPNLGVGKTAVSRILSMTEGNVAAGLTIATQRLSLLDCELALRSKSALEALYLSDDEAARIAPICQEVALSILDGSPSNGLAWLVRGAAAAHMGDTDGLKIGYARSVLVAPNEGWLVALRLRVAERNGELFGPNLQEFETRDLAFASGNPRYSVQVARRFVSDEAFRKRMTAILEIMPPERQRSFFSVVSNVLRAEGR